MDGLDSSLQDKTFIDLYEFFKMGHVASTDSNDHTEMNHVAPT